MSQYFTYRFTNVPKNYDPQDLYQLLGQKDRDAISSFSVGPCINHPTAFNVFTLTFSGEASHSKPALENIRVDDDFYGLTPLNTVAGLPKAEYKFHYSTFLRHVPLKMVVSLLLPAWQAGLLRLGKIRQVKCGCEIIFPQNSLIAASSHMGTRRKCDLVNRRPVLQALQQTSPEKLSSSDRNQR